MPDSYPVSHITGPNPIIPIICADKGVELNYTGNVLGFVSEMKANMSRNAFICFPVVRVQIERIASALKSRDSKAFRCFVSCLL